jgi:fluoroquinolone transport system ATP-binding protein
VRDLTFTYPRASSPAVRDVSFEVAKGNILGFLGPSGAGKTTVQNLMIGLLPVQHGSVKYEGKTLEEMGKSFYNRIGVSFENPNVYEKLTGLENLRFYGGLFDRPAVSPEKLLAMVGLADAAHKRASEYSKGMRQRLVFARSLVNRPDILFLDEPVSGLDPDTAQRIKEVILSEKTRGVTVFLTTHNMFVADELCDEVAFINEGGLVALDSPRDLKLKFGQKAVRTEYRAGGELRSELLFLDSETDMRRLDQLVSSGTVETMHSQEATLEQVFIKLTGRGLSS